MNPELDTLIERFRTAQDIGVDTLTRVFGFPLPASGRDWFRYCFDNGVYSFKERNGIGIYAHGYGVELKLDGLTIDFDFGPDGETDGFDGWRLYNFTLDNETGVACTHDDTNEWLDAAHRSRELTVNGDLYFDPRRRSNRTPKTVPN